MRFYQTKKNSGKDSRAFNIAVSSSETEALRVASLSSRSATSINFFFASRRRFRYSVVEAPTSPSARHNFVAISKHVCKIRVSIPYAPAAVHFEMAFSMSCRRGLSSAVIVSSLQYAVLCAFFFICNTDASPSEPPAPAAASFSAKGVTSLTHRVAAREFGALLTWIQRFQEPLVQIIGSLLHLLLSFVLSLVYRLSKSFSNFIGVD